MGIRRAAVLLAGSGLALVGLITLIVCWVQVATGSMLTGAGQEQPCVAAAAAGTDGARVHYAVLPPAAECRWVPEGVAQTVPLDAASATLSWAAAAAVLVGVVLIAVVSWQSWRTRRAQTG
ncbi:hypothetical protein [Cellulomonas sp. NPDC089187]|uniref:hypothetical protein n=1 Tax=Cellulomonas sp. NPDC089187 TaxID=3154970 RepID=UPI0034253B4A